MCCVACILSTHPPVMVTLLLSPVYVCSPSSAVGIPAILQCHCGLPGVSHLHVHHLWISWPWGHMAQVPLSLIRSAALWHVAQAGKQFALKSARPWKMKDGCKPKLTPNISFKIKTINQLLEPPCYGIFDPGWGIALQMWSQTLMKWGLMKDGPPRLDQALQFIQK